MNQKKLVASNISDAFAWTSRLSVIALTVLEIALMVRLVKEAGAENCGPHGETFDYNASSTLDLQ